MENDMTIEKEYQKELEELKEAKVIAWTDNLTEVRCYCPHCNEYQMMLRTKMEEHMWICDYCEKKFKVRK